MSLEKTILKHEDFFAASLNIKITSNDIVDKINAFDWLDLGDSNNVDQFQAITLRIFNLFNFQYAKKHERIIIKAFMLLFQEAVKSIKQAIEETSQSYNIEGGSKGFQNEAINRMYYIEYWSTKKHLPVNYNEKKQEIRELYNLDTILLSILADKLRVFNDFERSKIKK